jgi:hypothetical protein
MAAMAKDAIDLPKLSGGVISAEGRLDGELIRVTLAGTADAEARADLDVFVKKVHTESLRLAATAVAIDFREVEFMNSACFKIFVAWMAQLRDLAPDKQYRVQMRSNPGLLWQRRSLPALSALALGLVTIES